jgi:hypothetical protein
MMELIKKLEDEGLVFLEKSEVARELANKALENNETEEYYKFLIEFIENGKKANKITETLLKLLRKTILEKKAEMAKTN